MSAIRWTRTDQGASEILTVVRVDGDPSLRIEVCAGPEVGDDFVGLYDLDGDQIQIGNCEWSAVDESELTADQIESIRLDWESGTSTVERLLGRDE